MGVLLGLRNLRALELGVRRQNGNSTALVRWIDGYLKSGESEDEILVKRTVTAVRHASLEEGDTH